MDKNNINDSEYVKCYECNGHGYYLKKQNGLIRKKKINEHKFGFDIQTDKFIICPKCKGEGKIKWIEDLLK